MNCKSCRNLLVLKHYEELEANEQATLERHVKDCSDCQQFSAQLNQTQQALDQWEEIDVPIELDALHEAIEPKPRLRSQWFSWRWLSWRVVTAAVLLIGFFAFAWVGVDVKWKDHGVTIRLGPNEVPQISEQEVIRLLHAQRQATQAEITTQLQAALAEFSNQLANHLDERQKQTDARLALIYQAIQSQRAEDLRFVQEELQKLAGATEAELLEAHQALEFILASHVGRMQRNQ